MTHNLDSAMDFYDQLSEDFDSGTPTPQEMQDDFIESINSQAIDYDLELPNNVRGIDELLEEYAISIYVNLAEDVIRDAVLDDNVGVQNIDAQVGDKIREGFRVATENVILILSTIAAGQNVEDSEARGNNILSARDLQKARIVLFSLSDRIYIADDPFTILAIDVASERSDTLPRETVVAISEGRRNGFIALDSVEATSTNLESRFVDDATSEAMAFEAVMQMLTVNQHLQIIDYELERLNSNNLQEITENIFTQVVGYNLPIPAIRARILAKQSETQDSTVSVELGNLLTRIDSRIDDYHRDRTNAMIELSRAVEQGEIENIFSNDRRALGVAAMMWGGVVAVTNFLIGLMNPKNLFECSAYGMMGVGVTMVGASWASGDEAFTWVENIIEGIAYSQNDLENYGAEVVMEETRSITLGTSWQNINGIFANQTFIDVVRDIAESHEHNNAINDNPGAFLYSEITEDYRIQQDPELSALLNNYYTRYGEEQATYSMNFVANSYLYLGIETRDDFASRVSNTPEQFNLAEQ